MNRRQFVKGAVAGAMTLGVLRSVGVTTSAAADESTTPVGSAPGGGVFRADLSRAEPASALTRDFSSGRWQLVDYETEEGVKGSMLYARPEEECGILTLPLELAGPHRIYLGFNSTNSHYVGWSSHGQIDVRLTGDPGFKRVSAETGGAEGQDLFK